MNRIGGKQPAVTGDETLESASGPVVGRVLRDTGDFNKLRWLDRNYVFNPHHDGPWPYDVLADETGAEFFDDFLGQPSLLVPVASLTRLIQGDIERYLSKRSGYTFSFVDSYDSDGQGHAANSLHYEGRAIDIDPISPDGRQTPRDLAGLARFSGLAWLAGFDWVWYETSHVHVSMRESIRNAPPGDTNGDRVIDLNDMNNVRNNFGADGPHQVGDADGSGSIGLEDLNAVRNNFGAVAAPAMASQLEVEPEWKTTKNHSLYAFVFAHQLPAEASFIEAVDRVHEAQALGWQRWQEVTANTGASVVSMITSHRKPRRPLTT